MGVLEKLIGFRDPEGLSPTLQPVVEDNARNLAALARACAVAEVEPAPELESPLIALCYGFKRIEGLVDAPVAPEMLAMSLPGINNRLELGIREQPVGNDRFRQMGAVGRQGKRH